MPCNAFVLEKIEDVAKFVDQFDTLTTSLPKRIFYPTNLMQSFAEKDPFF